MRKQSMLIIPEEEVREAIQEYLLNRYGMKVLLKEVSAYAGATVGLAPEDIERLKYPVKMEEDKIYTLDNPNYPLS